MTAENVLAQFNITRSQVACVYPYGSRVYGTHNESSDHDWVIVYRSALLPNGAFKNNAITSADHKHQAICYSRSGFRSAVDSYDITALECVFLPKEQVAIEDLAFPVRKWTPKEMASTIITKASDSWFKAINHFAGGRHEQSKKGIFHAIRIIGFGQQMAEHGRIVDYSGFNQAHKTIFSDEQFLTRNYVKGRDGMIRKLKDLAAR